MEKKEYVIVGDCACIACVYGENAAMEEARTGLDLELMKGTQ